MAETLRQQHSISPPRKHRLLTLKLSVAAICLLVALSFVSWNTGLWNPVFDTSLSTLGSKQSMAEVERMVFAERISNLQIKIGKSMDMLEKIGRMGCSHCSATECGKLLQIQTAKQSSVLVEVVASLDRILELIRSPEIKNSNCSCIVTGSPNSSIAHETLENVDDEGLLQESREFKSKELQKYTDPWQNRHGRKNFMGSEAVHTSVGLNCQSMGLELETYMTYNYSNPCPDDWPVAQKLIINGCDPPPRRRCFAMAPKSPRSPTPNPSDLSILWTHYKCKSFSCLASHNTSKGFFKCSDCFDLQSHESKRWQPGTNTTAEFSIQQVLQLKPPGSILIGLDFGPGTGTFAAVMKIHNVTVVSATLNLGAPFNEMISLRGLVPIYVSVNQRLPFFDNTLDLVHSSLFLDGWIDVEVLEFILFDWDRVLRPGGLLWVDRFFCDKRDLDVYVGAFGKLGYHRRLWTVEDKKDKNATEVFLSAVLEKPVKSSRG